MAGSWCRPAVALHPNRGQLPSLPSQCVQAALPGMLERRQGRIVLVASTLSILGLAGGQPLWLVAQVLCAQRDAAQRDAAGQGALVSMLAMLATNCNCFSGACCLLAPTGYASYAPSKWAVRGLADCLHNELQGTGVHISVAYPPDTGERGCGWASMQRAGGCCTARRLLAAC